LPQPTPPPAPPAPTHTHCGWIGGGDTVGEAAFVANAAQFDTIHPKWWALADDGSSIRVAGNPDLATVVNAARANHVRLQPLVDGEGGDLIRVMLNDPTKRAAHAAALVKLAVDHGYDGLDLDYEHLNTIADRAPYTDFVTQVAAGLHAAGKELSLAVPAIAVEHNNNAYSYETLAGIVDTLHVMTYDFHAISTHLGPIAPLGWVDAVFARAQATGHPEKFFLGLANYAIGSGWWTTTRDALSRCGANLVATTDHMLTCSYGVWDAGRSPHCTTSSGDVWFEDLGSMGEKIAAAKKHGAGGVTYWTVGDEIDGYFDLVRRNFP
jgi:spore germination protein YaaH